MDYIKAFLVGGAICAIGQIFIDRTKLTPARILTAYVVIGVIVLVIYVLAKLTVWLQKYMQSKKLTEQLKALQQGESN